MTRGGVEAVLPRLLERALAAGMRVAVRVPDAGERAALDRWLWCYSAESFLAHAAEPCADADAQPVLLVAGDHAPNGAAMFVALAPPLPREGWERVALVFGEADAGAAREAWKAVKAEGGAAVYWKQGERGWERAAG